MMDKDENMDLDRALLLGHLEGSLSSEDAERVRVRLAAEQAFRDRLNALNALRGVMSDSRAESFAVHFSDRVMRRVLRQSRQAQSDVSLYGSLRWAFSRAGIAALVLATALGALNVADYQAMEATSSILESLFALPSTSLVDVLAAG